MNTKVDKNSQKPWFMSNVWHQMVSRPKQTQKDSFTKPGETQHSQIPDLTVPISAIGASLIIVILIIIILCFFRRKRGCVSDTSGPSIVVYPIGHGSAPQFLTKEILFSVPLRHSSSLGNLSEEDTSTETEPLVPVGRSYNQRSNSFSSYGLGVINPALYKNCSILIEEELVFPEDHIGRVWFSVQYELYTEKLLVSLLRAKNLPSRSLDTVRGCDPFVRLHLLPDERRYQQSKTKKKTCNPFFDESFIFQVPSKDLFDHTLKLTVIDSGRTKRRAVIGHVSVPLKDFANGTEEKLFKLDLEREARDVTSPAGELLISLLYNETLNRLSVTVVEGRKLKFRDTERCDSYVKVTLKQKYRSVKVKKTGTVRGTKDPKFFQCFNFHLTPDLTDVSSLCFEAYQSVSGCGRDKLIGKFVLGSYMFARGKGNVHWTSTFATPKEAAQQWHTLTG